MCDQFRIINKGKIRSEGIGGSIAKIDFLLVAENVLADDPVQGRSLRTGLLGADTRNEQAKKRKLCAHTWKNPHIQDKLTRGTPTMLPKHQACGIRTVLS
jgi:hypothetical protein